MKQLLLSALSLLFAFTCFAQEGNIENGLKTITRQSMEAQITFLADDLLEGRKVGTRGGALACEYIISQLTELGIKPFYETYAQPFIVTPKKGGKLNAVNVLGVIEGENPNQYVIVGAHYDHLGIAKEGVKGDFIYNGADDNASGVSAVLQIAKAFKANGEKPKKTIIFAFWDGEEIGLLGSKYFVEQFEDLSKIEMYMNFDMIGRNNDESNPKKFVYFYTEAYPQYGEMMKEHIKEYQLSELEPIYKAWDKPISGSDNRSFALHGISIIWYHTDGHVDYHKVTDSVEKLNWEKMIDITKSAYLNMEKIANQIN